MNASCFNNQSDIVFMLLLVNKPLQSNTFQPVWFKLHFIISYNYTQTALKTMAYSEATGGISVLIRTMVNLTLLKD